MNIVECLIFCRQYVDGIQVVDRGIRQVVKEVEEFYNNDSGTAYVFTADHGMTDWGSHGASDPEETNTPFVTWGAGIRSPESNYNDHFTTSHFADIINTSIQQVKSLQSFFTAVAFTDLFIWLLNV